METDTSQSKINIRHDWYQTEQYVVVTILIKNIKQEDLRITYTETNLDVNINLPEGQKHELNINLAHEINPEKSNYKIMSTKIEIKLMKSTGIHWAGLEKKPEEEEIKMIPIENPVGGPPRYPSSNPVHRDWDAIERDIVREFAQEKPTGDEGVNELFRKIYGEGSDEVKKAMNKSFLESGGTVLSTDWTQISKGKVPVKAPEGMEWKQWN